MAQILFRRLTRALPWLCAALFLWPAGTASAADAGRTIFQYRHTAWRVTDGAPLAIYALAQGRDGYLWLGSSSGLHRFDGVTFERIAPAAGPSGAAKVSALLAARDGTLWIGEPSGRIAFHRDGAFGYEPSVPRSDAYVMNLLETPDGAIWAQLGRPDRALLRRSDGAWREIGTDWGLPAEWLIDTFVARDGSLWVTTLGSILVLRQGRRRFELAGVPRGHAAVSEDPDGRIWLSDDRGTRILQGAGASDAAGLLFPTPAAARNFRARFDRRGNLWAVNADGLIRLRTPATPGHGPGDTAAGRVERFRKEDGLTSDSTVSILEDREGNIWVGTSLGLDRFQMVNVVVEPRLQKPPKWGFTLHAAADGTVYIGAADALYRAAPGGFPEPVPGGAGEVDTICGAPDGTVWAFLRDRLLAVRGDTVTRFGLPSGLGPLGVIQCVVDDRNVLWANGERDGLHRLAGSGRWEYQAPRADGGWFVALTEDTDRRLLALQKSGALVRLDRTGLPGERLLQFGDENVTMVRALGGRIYLGGSFGLGRIEKGALRLVDQERFPWLAGATGMVETADGLTWLLSAQGISGLPTAALERAFHDRDASLQPIRLGFGDGLPDINDRDSYRVSVVGGDGRIWFPTLTGVVWIDPAGFVRNPVPPPVGIRALLTGKAGYPDPGPGNLALAKGTSNVAIQYAGLSLAAPDRVRFRYRLDGVDAGWIDAGGRREAFYTNLQPGTYRFQVTATNGDGVWNTEGARLDFTIPPTFLQSAWFKLLCLLGAALFAWGLYALRLRQVTASLQHRFDVRVAERERIARELHDTLLQGFQGLVLRFQSVANRLPADGDLRRSVDHALEHADAVLVEGRARVREIRCNADVDLSQALLAAAADAAEGDAPRVELTVEGTPRRLHPLVLEETLRIGEEAIRNASMHAHAGAIDVLLVYGAREMRMAVRDDGIGLPHKVREDGGLADHFGLVGMRERATRIGGRLAVTSREGRGTEISLVLPARAAYADHRARATVLGALFPGERRP